MKAKDIKPKQHIQEQEKTLEDRLITILDIIEDLDKRVEDLDKRVEIHERTIRQLLDTQKLITNTMINRKKL